MFPRTYNSVYKVYNAAVASVFGGKGGYRELCHFKDVDKFSFSRRMNIDWQGSTCQKAISGEYVKEVAYIGVSTA